MSFALKLSHFLRVLTLRQPIRITTNRCPLVKTTNLDWVGHWVLFFSHEKVAVEERIFETGSSEPRGFDMGPQISYILLLFGITNNIDSLRNPGSWFDDATPGRGDQSPSTFIFFLSRQCEPHRNLVIKDQWFLWLLLLYSNLASLIGLQVNKLNLNWGGASSLLPARSIAPGHFPPTSKKLGSSSQFPPFLSDFISSSHGVLHHIGK